MTTKLNNDLYKGHDIDKTLLSTCDLKCIYNLLSDQLKDLKENDFKHSSDYEYYQNRLRELTSKLFLFISGEEEKIKRKESVEDTQVSS